MSCEIFYRPKISATILLLGFLTIGGCGGGGSSTPAPTPPSPPSPSPPADPAPLPLPPPPDPRAQFETEEYEAQYGLGAIGASAIYVEEYSGEGVLVAVADNGVDMDHPDLAENIVEDGHYNFNYCYRVDYDDMDPTNDCTEAEKRDVNHHRYSEGLARSHGTYVAGIIAAKKNGIGIHGVAYNAKLLVFNIVRNVPRTRVDFPYFRTPCSKEDILNDRYENCDFHIIPANRLIEVTSANWIRDRHTQQSIHRAVDEQVSVINLSLEGGFNPDTAEELKRAHGANIVSVIAAGNSGSANPGFHAFLPSQTGYEDLKKTLIAVVSTDKNSEIATSSNRCGAAKEWCLAAPGVNIYTTIDGDDERWTDPNAFFNRKYREAYLQQLREISIAAGLPPDAYANAFNRKLEIESGGTININNYIFLRDADGNVVDISGRKGKADGNPDDGFYGNIGSGTSFAAPHVTGAVAVLRGAWPSKSAEEITTILFETAKDLGDPGVDEIYGRGLLDLAEAVRPQGALLLYSPSGAAYPLAELDFRPSAAFGNSIERALGESAVFDKYKRDYRFDLSRAVRPPDISDFDEALFDDDGVSFALGPNLRFSRGLNENFSVAQNDRKLSVLFAHRQNPAHIFASGGQNQNPRFWTKYLPDANPYFAQITDADIFRIRRTDKISIDFGVASGRVRDHQNFTMSGARFALAAKPAQNFSLSAGFGQMHENQTFLSNYFAGAYQTEGAKTHTASLALEQNLGAGFTIIGQLSRGRTAVAKNPDALVAAISDIRTEGRALSLIKRGLSNRDDILFFSLANPLRVAAGEMTINVAEGLNMDDSIRFGARKINLAPAHKTTEMALGYGGRYRGNDFVLRFNHRKNPNHSALGSDNQLWFQLSRQF